MSFTSTDDVRVRIPEHVLFQVFDECDRFDIDETGGRVLGHYEEKGAKLFIDVTAVLGPGPNARRTSTYFLQDGEHQEVEFRKLEERDPDLEHLGNWHTHHVNGLPHLSGGDIETYEKIVNHQNHNTDFFYALLVVSRTRAARETVGRYEIKHYLRRRGDDRVYEIPSNHVEVIAMPPKVTRESEMRPKAKDAGNTARPDRAKDAEFFKEFFPNFKSLASKSLGIYWRGRVELVDGSQIEILTVEAGEDPTPYRVILKDPSPSLTSVVSVFDGREFSSARAAVIHAQRLLDRAVFAVKRDERDHNSSTKKSRGKL